MRMALEKQTMQLAWSRRRALGIPGPLQHRIRLSQPRMLLPHLMMSPHRHRMTKDKFQAKRRRRFKQLVSR
uniref:Uncharacterized protein n=1 Tax=Glycine max TaxID=3847 RepID=C6T1I0_SOYBN|nr:unknown [Glycine max]